MVEPFLGVIPSLTPALENTPAPAGLGTLICTPRPVTTSAGTHGTCLNSTRETSHSTSDTATAASWCASSMDTRTRSLRASVSAERSVTLHRRPSRLSLWVADSDDGAESALRGECPFDSRDDVQERDYPGNLEDPFDDRRSPQHDIELAIEFSRVFQRLQEDSDDRGVDELGG